MRFMVPSSLGIHFSQCWEQTLMTHLYISATQPPKLTTIPAGDEIFHYRTKAVAMFMPLTGTLVYTSGRPTGQANYGHNDLTSIRINKGGWLCEQPLWIGWENRGLLTVGAQSDVAIIHTAKFQKVATFHASSLPLLQQYAVFFAKALSDDAAHGAIDDLWGTYYGNMIDLLESAPQLARLLEEGRNDNVFVSSGSDETAEGEALGSADCDSKLLSQDCCGDEDATARPNIILM